MGPRSASDPHRTCAEHGNHLRGLWPAVSRPKYTHRMKKLARRKRSTRKRGRPATGQDPVTAIRLSAELREIVDHWAARQPDKPRRSEAIRRLLEVGLAGFKPAGRRSQTAKVLRMAAREIGPLVDKSAPPEERIKRKRRLLKGPREFREMRKD